MASGSDHIRFHLRRAWGAAVLAGALAWCAGTEAGALRLPRGAALAALYPPPAAAEYTGAIIVKFEDGAGVQPAAGGARGFATSRTEHAPALAAVAALLAKAGAGEASPVFSRPPATLDAERLAGEQAVGQPLPDLTLFHRIPVPDHAVACRLLSALNSNALVEVAYAEPRPCPPPATPDLSANQTYLGTAAVNGYDVRYAWAKPGGNGSHIRLIDIEYDWYLDHEDLLKPWTNLLWGARYTAYGADHGTATLGISGAISNGIGMLGIVHAADIKVISSVTAGGSYRLADAINQAALNTQPGDVILLEQQSSNGGVYGPVEYWSDVYAAIAAATALDRIIIEPAGNGSSDLDGSLWGGIFSRAVRDSRAIMVGAGTAAGRARCSFSDYGSRCDVQGWGDWSVASCGYTDLYGNIASNRYTRSFSGTSSASALTAAIAASVQSYAKARYGFALPPLALRTNLAANGYAQSGSGNIGPLPNLSNSYVNVDALAADPDTDGMANWQEQIAGTDRTNGQSRLVVQSAARAAVGGVTLTWKSVSNRFYRIERTTNLAASAYATVVTDVVGRVGATTCTDLTATASGPYFYRVRVRPW